MNNNINNHLINNHPINNDSNKKHYGIYYLKIMLIIFK